jgi:hypothetical protein
MSEAVKESAMPLAKFVLLLLSVIAAAGLTIGIAVFAAASLQAPLLGGVLLLPALLIGYVVWRVIADRLQSREDDHYDRTPR